MKSGETSVRYLWPHDLLTIIDGCIEIFICYLFIYIFEIFQKNIANLENIHALFTKFLYVLWECHPAYFPFFPEVIKVIKLLFVFPVSVVNAERSSSTQRRLKTWLRNAKGQKRLNAFAVCNIHTAYSLRVLMLTVLISMLYSEYDNFIRKIEECCYRKYFQKNIFNFFLKTS